MGILHPSELTYLIGRASAFSSGEPPPLVIYLHGALGGPSLTVVNVHERPLLRALAKKSLVACSLWGGSTTFGNSTAISRVVSGIASLRTSLNVDLGPTILVGGSMGAGTALAVALSIPGEIACVAGIIPALDLADLRDNNRLGLASSIDAAYGGAYDDEIHGPAHSPVRFAQELPEDLPVRLWTSSNDTATVPSTADEFVSLRPQTERTNMGAVGHSTASYAGVQQDMADWCLAQV